ncbi:hypothetical protein Pan216_36310 [Planctomycetes bacterium Pan216]|uniref:3-keto-disaccharide hydrolase domain-containing protein n=1 Tax=Kolteria novifilia TaxID=2527975 RepID=A0A518B728_9BACT|nr:hypothetical protein Pan216_36310 [Planctomycetes bacterium Pan216]
MQGKGFRRLLIFLVPGLLLCLIVLGWGFFVQPPRYEIAEWKGRWTEPKFPSGTYKSWRPDGDLIIGETEGWPHKHPRANSYLVYDEEVNGDVDVTMRVVFERGRYLGCYLCFDPETSTGYWLSTGHAVGKNPNKAYIKKFFGPREFPVQERGPLEINPGQEYTITFRRRGDALAVIVDGKTIVSWEDGAYRRGQVRLRLHNTKLEILSLEVLKGKRQEPSEGSVAPQDELIP